MIGLDTYKHQGYIHFENYFHENDLLRLEDLLKKFHQKWLKENEQDYKNGLINSHSITSSDLIHTDERLFIFKFITQDKIQKIVQEIFPNKALFLNTQLFFDPFNPHQNNYWHRDIQYTGMKIEDQQQAIKTQNVIHFRIPFKPELGIELIPSTHKKWDSMDELETRLALNGRKPSDNLEEGKTVKMNRGDLLVFSANMIHRGLYGNDRFTFDIIFCDDTTEFRTFLDQNNHPSKSELELLTTTFIF
ncbi:phytanoyl-CoA dioxygenase family protein [Empedobacter brevis]|uniref:phytanoyl-CoA dioxygenase family protein n=1 Tax=Empedobacter brevis TaxID=247 RepID=UPI002FE346E9